MYYIANNFHLYKHKSVLITDFMDGFVGSLPDYGILIWKKICSNYLNKTKTCLFYLYLNNYRESQAEQLFE